VRRARRGLLLFGLILTPLSLLGYWFYGVTKASAPPLVPDLPLMLSPALASTITRLVLREGFSDVSFRFGGRCTVRAIVLGLALPLLAGSLAYGLAYLTGLTRFAPPALSLAGASVNPVAGFALILVLAATLGTLILLPAAAGEEIGWRGYLLPRLIEAGAPQPVLLSGLIWGAWHLVPVLASGYAAGPSPLFSATNLMIATVSLGSVLAWMRLGTGSIWPCIVAHAAWNAIINGAFDLATQGPAATFWTGESGFLVMLVLLLAMLVMRPALKPARRRGLDSVA
jgi:membrane protease YdiL (CAAX protease family)